MKKFLQELKRRNVLKASLSYVAISWALLQVGALILPLLGMNTSVLRIFLIVLACGFPVWVVFAYFYELTPGGFKPTSEVAEEKSIHKHTSKKLNGYIMAALSLAVVFLVADRFLDFEVSLEETDSQKSIAVLPFENLSSPDDEYFTTGITEDILTQITNISDLRVLSRFTLKEYDSKGKSPNEIGKELGVSNLLVGSIRKRDDQLRVSCQLIETSNEAETWAQIFEMNLEDVFKIQSEIALEIADNLKTKLTPQEKQRITATSTKNIAAYNVYLRGRGLYDTYTSENNEKAILLFKEALRLDPNYGLAYAGLADAYGQSYWEFGTRNIKALDEAKAFAERGTELNPDQPETWKALGLCYTFIGNTEEAKKNYRKALSLNPNHQESVNNYGVMMTWEGDLPEAIKMYKRSAALQPLSAPAFFNLAWNYAVLDLPDISKEYADLNLDLINDEVGKLFSSHLFTYVLEGDKELARSYLYKAAEMEPDNVGTITGVGGALTGFHEPELGKPFLEKAVKMEEYDPKSDPETPINIAYLLLREGKHLDSAKALLNTQIQYFEAQIGNGNDRFMTMLMMGYSVNEEGDKALEAMKKLLDNGFTTYRRFEIDNRLEELRKQEGYQELMDDLKARLAIMRKQVIEDDASGQLARFDL